MSITAKIVDIATAGKRFITGTEWTDIAGKLRRSLDVNARLFDEDGNAVPVGSATDPAHVQVISFPALDKDTDSITTKDELSASLGHGVATVDSAGTDEPLSATSLVVKWVIIQAIPKQIGEVALGGEGVDATATTGTGILLEESDSVKFGPCDLADIYLDATISGNGVRYTYGV